MKAAILVRLYHRSQSHTAVPQMNAMFGFPLSRSGIGCPDDGKKQSIR